ncbi:MAG: AAA family ATPase [Planctomycetota bacterium]
MVVEDPSSLASVQSIREQLNLALRGKGDAVERVLQCLLAKGHLLIEDLPGLGKTTLAKALARALGGMFSRVQCTPDLMPGDITGFSVFNQKNREFEFMPGPVFSDILLADEVNRTTPRTQSALLEAMAEGQVSIDGKRHALSPAFMVIATQNPVEHHGTYPLPEAQLDRFAMRLSLGYPNPEAEAEMLLERIGTTDPSTAKGRASVGLERLVAIQEEVANVAMSRGVIDYLVSLANATRRHSGVRLGLSPRGLLIWQRVSQARAYIKGRGFVTPDDIQDVAESVLRVRLGCQAGVADGITQELLREVPVPA